MNADRPSTWVEANQRYLIAVLGVVRTLLETHAARAAGGEAADPADHTTVDAAKEVVQWAAREMPSPSALDTLSAAFALSPFERNLLVLAAGVELDASFGALYAAAHGDARRAYPTFGLALAALPDAHWSAVTPAAPLRRWRLIDVGPGESLAASPLRVEERVVHYLAGVAYLDERLRGLVEPAPSPVGPGAGLRSDGEDPNTADLPPGLGPHLPASQEAVAQQIVRIWSRPHGTGTGWPAVQLCGDGSAGTEAIAAWACAEMGLTLHTMRAGDLPQGVTEREELGRLWEREAALSGSALLLNCDEVDTAEARRTVAAFVEDTQGMIVLGAREPLATGGRATARLPVPRPTAAEQRALWEHALAGRMGDLNGQLDAVVAQFSLGLPAIQAVSAQVLGAASTSGDSQSGSRLWDACRAQARPRLEDLAQRIEPAATWDDLVLPALPRGTLRDLAAHVRRRDRVYGDWGFAAKSSRGLGISALFAGASGTGKTMAAEVLAHELRLDLYRIDLSQVVSKYIGETEKNLRRVFDAAEEGGVILLFDEADALFGKRSEVKDSHDRYANIEVSYLLQRMESYRGLAILTTNMRSALDPAFLRRIRFVVQFPFPDAAQRVEIWRRVFPALTPTEGLQVERLARLNVAGGNIRNIALNAAFLAADEDRPVCMEHLLRAARSEYVKLEKPLTEAEISGWA